MQLIYDDKVKENILFVGCLLLVKWISVVKK